MNASGQLPLRWEWARLGDICEIRREQVNPQDKQNEKFNYLSIENIESNSGDLVNFAPTVGKDIKSSKLVFTSKDILYSKLRPYLNKVHVPTFDGVSATDLIPIRPLGGIPREYIAYFLRARRTVDYANQKMRGIQLPRLPVDELLVLPLPVAPLPEQERIVTKLKSMFRQSKIAKSALNKVPPLLRKFRQSVLAAAFRGELTEADSRDEPASVLLERIRQERRRRWGEDLTAKGKDPRKYEYKEPEPVNAEGLPELPERWAWIRLEELCATASGGTPLRSKKEYYRGKIPWLKSGELEDNVITETQETITQLGLQKSSAKIFPKGTVLIALYGATVGKTGMLGTDAATNQAVCAILNNQSVVDSEYLFLYLRSKREDLLKRSFGGAQPNISQEIIRKLEIPFCSIGEQNRVVRKIQQMFAYADRIEKSAETARSHASQLEQSILAHAFRGELVPQDPNEEPASVLLERIRAQRAETVKRGKFSRSRQTLLEIARPAKVSAKG